jgi:hypothetical protein
MPFRSTSTHLSSLLLCTGTCKALYSLCIYTSTWILRIDDSIVSFTLFRQSLSMAIKIRTGAVDEPCPKSKYSLDRRCIIEVKSSQLQRRVEEEGTLHRIETVSYVEYSLEDDETLVIYDNGVLYIRKLQTDRTLKQMYTVVGTASTSTLARHGTQARRPSLASITSRNDSLISPADSVDRVTLTKDSPRSGGLTTASPSTCTAPVSRTSNLDAGSTFI